MIMSTHTTIDLKLYLSMILARCFACEEQTIERDPQTDDINALSNESTAENVTENSTGTCVRDQECALNQKCDLTFLQCYEIECQKAADCSLDYICDEGRCLVDLMADQDRDGIPNGSDNCSAIQNAGQSDLDQDRQGDVCDEDMDGDGIENTIDNCPQSANTNQMDGDGDGIGDLCQGDRDSDLWMDSIDNYPEINNPSQSDRDQDGIGDVCDEDLDGDGIANAIDNCPLLSNEEQRDSDQDGIGDLCSAENLWVCGDCGIKQVIDGRVECLQKRCSPYGDSIQQCVSNLLGDGSWVQEQSCIVEQFGVLVANTCQLENDEPICTLLSYCGDGVLDANEQCDDGNRNSSDGCSATCQYEDYIPDMMMMVMCAEGEESSDCDGDGYLMEQDCNDHDANSTHRAIDADCDGYLTE